MCSRASRRADSRVSPFGGCAWMVEGSFVLKRGRPTLQPCNSRSLPIRVHPCPSVVNSPAMKLSEMKALLASGQIRLTKSLGQNFLHDTNQLRRIVDAAALKKTDKVLEIGPGLGPLTELLVEQAGEVLAIEKDARLAQALNERFKVGQASRLPPAGQEFEEGRGGTPVLRLLQADALEFLRREPRDWGEWKVVSNLPFSVASPILVELAQGQRGPQ